MLRDRRQLRPTTSCNAVTIRSPFRSSQRISKRGRLAIAFDSHSAAAFILTDPIFQGLAISLVFGLASSTALTLLVIPAIYVWLMGD